MRNGALPTRLRYGPGRLVFRVSRPRHRGIPASVAMARDGVRFADRSERYASAGNGETPCALLKRVQ